MAGIGEDIAEVIKEMGVLVTILRTPKDIKEYMSYEVDTSTSRAFYQEYVLNASFTFNSVVKSGDVVIFNADRIYLVTTVIPDTFENSVVENNVTLYKNNFPDTAMLLSPSKVQDPDTFKITHSWVEKKVRPYGLIYKTDYNAPVFPEDSTGRDVRFSMEAVIPSEYLAAVGDRILLTDSEYYRIQDIEKYKFSGMDLLTLVSDERPL